MMHELFVCNCGSPEHQLIVTDFGDGEEVYVEIHLAPLPLWRRLWVGQGKDCAIDRPAVAVPKLFLVR